MTTRKFLRDKKRKQLINKDRPVIKLSRLFQTKDMDIRFNIHLF